MKENSLLNKLDHLVSRFEEVNTLISDPNVISDMQRYVKLNKEYIELQIIMEARNEYKNAYDSIEEAKQILDNESDSELRQLAQDELSEYSKQLPKLEEKIKYLLIPSDPEDDKNVIMEIREAQEVMKLQFLQAIYIRCILDFANRKVGQLKLQV